MNCLRLGSVRDSLCLIRLIRALRGHRHVAEDRAGIARLWMAFGVRDWKEQKFARTSRR
jgi:hypothetical protein